MLALSRKIGERIRIGDDIVIEVRGIFNNRVVLAVSAPYVLVIDRLDVHVPMDKMSYWIMGGSVLKGQGELGG